MTEEMGISSIIWRAVFVYFYLIVFSITEDVQEEVFDIIADRPITINCTNSFIEISTISISSTGLSCQRDYCILQPEDVTNTKRQCDGHSKCTIDFQWTTDCLHEIDYPSVTLAYYCKVLKDLNCHFEHSFCGWNPSAGDTTWIIGSKANLMADHTTAMEYGQYAYIDRSQTSAKMSSGYIKTYNTSCMTFWYYINGVLEISILNETGYTNHTWSKKVNNWTKGEINLEHVGSYEIFITGRPKKDSKGVVALDDVYFVDGLCSEMSYIYCNFERDDCGFKIIPGDKRLERRQGSSENVLPEDHTTNSANGHYLLFEWGNINHTTNKTSVIIKNITAGRKCFSVWYYMIGQDVGTLNIYGSSATAKNKTDLYISIPNDNQKRWRPVYILMDVVQQIILEYQFKPKSTGAIALDDIYIYDGECTVKSFKSTCLGLYNEVEFDCPVQDVIDPELTFDPPLQTSANCQTEHSVRKSVADHCQNIADNIPCKFNLSHFIRDIDVCFALRKQLLIEYSCTGTTLDDIESTTTSYSTVVTNSLAENQNQGSSNSTGLTAGVVIAVCIIVVIGVVIVIFIRRRSLSANEKTNHNIDGRNTDDYIGNQSNALPPTNGHVKTVSTKNNYNDLESRYDKQHYTEIKEDGFPQVVTGKTQHDYIDIYPENNVAEQKTTAVQPPQNEIGYTCLDPAENGFNRMKAMKQELEKAKSSEKNTGLFTNSDNLDESKIDTSHPVTPENYTILDPNETGFDRSKSPEHRASPYDLAKPIQNHENDPYFLSKEGEYDSTSNIRHKETDENVYSHSVENVYDSARFKRDKDGKDDTYDHFFGQKTEDDYDISKST